MSDSFRTSIDVEATPERVFDHFVRPELLVRWMGDVARLEAGRRSLLGRVCIAADTTSGVVDFYMSPAPGIEGLAASRVVPGGDGVEYIFTQFQAPGMTDDMFAKSVEAVAHELAVLKALLEVECPL